MKKMDKLSIEILCQSIIENLGKINGGLDSLFLKNSLDLVFLEQEERDYAYEYSYEYIKEKLDARHTIEREGGER